MAVCNHEGTFAYFCLLNEIPELVTFFVIFSVYNNSEIFGNGLGCHLSVPFI